MLNKGGWVKDVCISCKIKMFKKCHETSNLRLSLEKRDCAWIVLDKITLWQ